MFIKSYINASIIGMLVCSFVIGEANAQKSAESTTLVVRAQSKDAKFIGTSMGGAFITIKEVKSQEILAKGFTEGSTGDTQRLINEPKNRYDQLHTPGAAKFETTLELTEPTLVTVNAVAPYAKRQAHVESSTQLWLIPGKDIIGDGIILEIPGFVVDVLSPRTHQTVEGAELDIKANVVMMCGCPTSDGGLWDSSEYEIEALIKKDGDIIDTVPLAFTGQTSMFSAGYTAPESGVYEIIVTAYHDKTGNTGIGKSTVISVD